MTADQRSEVVQAAYFRWRLVTREGVFQADGRRNSPSPGRHSLGTRDRTAALERLKKLDHTQAVALGISNETPSGEQEIPQLTFENGVSHYLQHVGRAAVVGGASPKTIQRYRAVFDKAVPFFQSTGLSAWNQVRRRHLEQYASWLDKQGYAYASQLLEITTLKQAFRYWILDEFLPAECQIRLHVPKPTTSNTYCWMPQEVETIVRFCGEDPRLIWMADLITLLACTGLRISEAAGLRSTDICLESGMISLTDERHSSKDAAARTIKNKRGRAFPIHDELRAVLERRLRVVSDGSLFRGPRGAKLIPDQVRRVLMNDVLRPLSEKLGSSAQASGFLSGRLHSFRHFFCSRCCDAGVPEIVVMEWLGHRSSAMVRRYYHLKDDVSRLQMSKPSFIRGALAQSPERPGSNGVAP